MNGDLSVNGASLDTITAGGKLIQDLRCWILEHMGTDNLHPSFGCLIDGGQQLDGTLVESVIGGDDPAQTELIVESEIQRIVGEYQAQQLSRAKSDRFIYNKVTLTAEEVLLGLSNLSMTMDLDTLRVLIGLQTATGQTIDLGISVPTDI